MSEAAYINVSDFIDNEYRAYSLHTITHRAIPLLVDGLKPVQRKTLFTALKECKVKEVKVSSLGGMLPKIGAYHHGSASGEDAITKMAQEFNNNVCLLEGIGSFGSRPVPVAAAARYIHTKLSENYNIYFTDSEILPLSMDKEDHPEPICYLPLIPFSLVNGSNGVAVGAASKILPRNPRDVATACKEYIETGKVSSQLRPYVKNFKGKFKKYNNEGKYIVSGAFSRISNGGSIKITEVPLGITHEQYVKHLDKLKMETNPIFTSYVDDTDSAFEFTLKLSKTGKQLTDEELIKKLKLETTFTENLTLIVFDDMSKIPDDKTQYALRAYDNTKQMISDFVEFRMQFFVERIRYNIERINNEINDLIKRIDFVESVVDGKFIIKNKTRKQMLTELTKSYGAEYAEKFVGIPIYSLSKDNIQKMKNRLKELYKELKYWESCDAKDLFVSDLDTLIEKIS